MKTYSVTLVLDGRLQLSRLIIPAADTTDAYKQACDIAAEHKLSRITEIKIKELS